MKTLLLTLLVLASCGIKVSGIPSHVDGTATFGPDFVGAAAFCDNRYGPKTTAAEACFQDYVNYTKITIQLDLTSILDYCNKTYTDPLEQQQCVTDLTNVLQGALAPKSSGGSGSGSSGGSGT